MKRIATILLFSFLFFTSYAQQIGDTVRIHPIISLPPNPSAINIVILGDGYQDSTIANSTDDFDKFNTDATALLSRFIATSPFMEYQDYFNIYTVFAPSDSSGVYNPCTGLDVGGNCQDFLNLNPVSSTYYHSRFSAVLPTNNDSISRLLHTDRTVVNAVVSSSGFDTLTTPVFMLVNSSYFGGSGAPMLASSCTDIGGFTSPNKALHEFAHSFSGVRDEYWIAGSEAFVLDTINMSDTNLLAEVPWKNWVDTTLWYAGIEDTTNTALADMNTLPVGVYPHLRQDAPNTNSVSGTTQWAYDQDSIIGWFKPTTYYNCKLEDINKDYCPVCREAIIERIHGLAPAMYGYAPDNTDTLTASETISFNIDLIQTSNNTVVVEWWLNGDSITTNNGLWNLDCYSQYWNIGLNTLTAIVEDHTPFIRIDDHSAHTQSVSWNIEYNGAEADLWIRDLIGDQGNTNSPAPIPYGSYDHGPDLWVRNQTDGVIEHQSPSFAQDSVFVYTRIFNRGCKTSNPQRELTTYFTLAGPANAWPTYFDGTLPDTGNVISATVLNTTIATGDSAIIVNEWNLNTINSTVLNNQNYNVCLLARLDSVATDPIAFNPSLGEYIYYNNNMVMHNMMIVDVDSAGFEVVNGNKFPPGGFILIGNPTNSNSVFDIHFDAPPTPSGKPLSKEAEIYLVFDNNAWDIGTAIKDSDLAGLTRKDANTFIATADNAAINNISIPANTRVPLYIGFGFLTKEVEPNLEYDYQVTQWKSGATGPMGGELYRILRNQRYLFAADPGPDKTVDKNAQVTVSATDITEPAIYNWYDMAGNLVYSGKDLTVTADITKKYRLEVIANADGYKDYSEVEVKVKMGELTNIIPNPATGQTVIDYHTQGATSAYISIHNVATGSASQYIINLGQGSLTLDLAGYATGNYTVLLVADGAVRDNMNLMVE